MTEKRFRVNELVKYNYSEIGEYIDENHTDRPLRNDILVELLNEQHETIQRLKQNIDELLSVNIEEELLKENEQLKQENRKLKENLEHCANQFTNDGKNVLLSLR